MEYMGTSEASDRWGYSQSTIQKWCRDGKIEGAEQDAKERPWRIPVNAQCPKPIRSKYDTKIVS